MGAGPYPKMICRRVGEAMIEGREELLERLQLARGRVLELNTEDVGEELSPQIPAEIKKSLTAYIHAVCDYLGSCFFVMDRLGEGIFSDEGPRVSDWKEIPLSDWKEINRRLYQPLADGAYEKDFSNPDRAAGLGTYGEVLSFLLAEFYSFPKYIFDGKLFMIVTLLELFLEIFGKFCQDTAPTESQIRESVMYYAEDYAEEIASLRLRDTFLVTDSVPVQILMKEDLSDPAYLYKYGEYISDTELRLAEFMQTLTDDEVDSMARTFTAGFRRGFDTMRISFEGKKSVSIRYAIGQERMVRRVAEQFQDMGLSPILSRPAGSRLNRKGVVRQGVVSTPVCRQFEYDHRMDEALYLNRRYMERKMAALRTAYAGVEEHLPEYAGPAVVETFGEDTFLPEAKDTCIRLSEEQRALATELTGLAGQLAEEKLPGDSYSFSIISYPIPEIGDSFEEIFRETVRINTMENQVYLPLQQLLIDAMDPADHILVEGSGENRTRMKVKMRKLEHPDAETQFENCVADVNIPLGEVFTSPVLEGTEGVLHVSGVYLNGYFFKDLELTFRDGTVREYRCGNYQDEEAGRRYIRENILFHHETLPIGEFAIGTNVPAYRMAKQYDILGKLPILIVEKTGPHFAVGDTCYSHAEDTAVYNPDGKEIVSRENTFSLLRDTEPEKAYFNCHTDVTIPYDEIGRITAVYPDGTEKDILRDGRFVLPGTELLNDDVTE